MESCLEPWIGRTVFDFEGSISAEHGIGVAKRAMFHETGNADALNTMRFLKKQFDPNNILNPEKVV